MKGYLDVNEIQLKQRWQMELDKQSIDGMCLTVSLGDWFTLVLTAQTFTGNHLLEVSRQITVEGAQERRIREHMAADAVLTLTRKRVEVAYGKAVPT